MRVSVDQAVLVNAQLVQPLRLTDDDLALFPVDGRLLDAIAQLLCIILLLALLRPVDEHLDGGDADEAICTDAQLLALVNHALAAAVDLRVLDRAADHREAASDVLLAHLALRRHFDGRLLQHAVGPLARQIVLRRLNLEAGLRPLLSHVPLHEELVEELVRHHLHLLELLLVGRAAQRHHLLLNSMLLYLLVLLGQTVAIG